jgi:hypothetical protein
MFDSIIHVINIFTDKTVNWTTKSATGIIIVLVLLFTNNIFDFVHSYRTNNKLEQLDKIRVLLQDTTLTDKQKTHFVSERQYILDHKTVLDYVHLFFRSFSKKISFTNRKTEYNNSVIDTAKATDSTIPLIKNENSSSSIKTKNYWLHFFSSNLTFILIILFATIQAYKQHRHQFWELVFAIFVVYFFSVLFFMFFSHLLDFIPVIFNRPWINYVLNFIIQLVIWLLFGLMTAYKQNK